MIALLCSGQGAQFREMFDVVGGEDAASEVFAAAAAALDGRDPRDLARDAASDIHENRTAQILCCAQALAWWSVLEGAGALPDDRLVAGYSVGEVAAWSVAGAMAPAALFAAVSERARLMDAQTCRPAAMIAVRGLDRDALADLCRRADVHVAIRTAPDRAILAGWSDDVREAAAEATGRGARVTHLDVNVPSHTPLLAAAAESFERYLVDASAIAMPAAPVLSGIDGSTVADRTRGLRALGRQIARTVEWGRCMRAIEEAGTSTVLELGPGRDLATMTRDRTAIGRCRSVDEFRSVAGVVAWLNGSSP